MKRIAEIILAIIILIWLSSISVFAAGWPKDVPYPDELMNKNFHEIDNIITNYKLSVHYILDTKCCYTIDENKASHRKLKFYRNGTAIADHIAFISPNSRFFIYLDLKQGKVDLISYYPRENPCIHIQDYMLELNKISFFWDKNIYGAIKKVFFKEDFMGDKTCYNPRMVMIGYGWFDYKIESEIVENGYAFVRNARDWKHKKYIVTEISVANDFNEYAESYLLK